MLGLLVSLPVLGWSISGFFLALPPGAIQGEPYRAIDPARVTIGAVEALEIATAELGPQAQVSALNLEQRGESAFYSAFGGGEALSIDATTGVVSRPEATPASTKLLRHAHFYNFAGPARTWLLLLFSLLSACSSGTGLWLAARWFWRRRYRVRSPDC